MEEEEEEEEEQVEGEEEEAANLLFFNPAKPQTCKNPQGLDQYLILERVLFYYYHSSLLVTPLPPLLLYSLSSLFPPSLPSLYELPGVFSRSLALTKPDTPWEN